jgi:hypothetical protein
LGGVFGVLIALAIEFFPAFAKTARNFLMFPTAPVAARRKFMATPVKQGFSLLKRSVPVPDVI